MSIKLAEKCDLATIKDITAETIRAIYPHYYPRGAVEFFISFHSEDSISRDIDEGCVFICLDSEQNVVGTVTVRDNEICRLFVLPRYQGKGYGGQLIQFAESLIAESFREATLSASLPAKQIYLNRKYIHSEYHTIKASCGDYLCYDVMTKSL